MPYGSLVAALLALGGAPALANASPAIVSGGDVLGFPVNADGSRGVAIVANGDAPGGARSNAPVQILVCGACYDEMTDQPSIGAGYASVAAANGAIVATADVRSAAGSVFHVVDRYSAGAESGTFAVARTVSVATAVAADRGFNSQYLLGFAAPKPLAAYHFFAPAIWYDKNAYVKPYAFAGTYTNSYFYWRETRSALPLVMMQDPASGLALSLGHVDASDRATADEKDPGWIVSPAERYGSIGAQRVPQTTLGFIYPADEGQGTYVAGSGPWVRRSNPVAAGFTHAYRLLLGLRRYAAPGAGAGADFPDALTGTWRVYEDAFAPSLTQEPIDTVYRDGIALAATYSADRYGAQGLPFAAPLATGVPSATSATSYEMGFVGQQIPLGFELVRHGVLDRDPAALAKGKAMLDFWASRSQQPSGLPYTWYDATTGRFVNTACANPIFLRQLADGLEGMASAAVFAREHGIPQPAWERYARRFADWLVAHQNRNGSFYRAYDPDGAPYTATCDPNAYGTSEFNTTNPVRFLVQMYYATGDPRYRTAAERAGAFAIRAVYEPTAYVGGVIDNPDVLDKLGGAEALRAALALYDLDHDPTWLVYARQAANYTETWQYEWTFPIANAPPNYAYSGTRAIGPIATGQSSGDIALSYEAYDFFRLHLFGDVDDHYLRTARLLQNETKLTTQLTGVPAQQFGFAHDGFVGEGVGLSGLAFLGSKSSQTWLPWLTEGEIEPLQRLEDTFGSMSIERDDAQPAPILTFENEHVYGPPGIPGWGTPLGTGAGAASQRRGRAK